MSNEPRPEEVLEDDGDDFIVNHEKVEGKVDYDKLIVRFGSEKITSELVDRVEQLTGKKAHRWLRRGYFFSHRFVYIYLYDNIN